jgi:alpha-1,3-rhamnosyl/mannosyltransferase
MIALIGEFKGELGARHHLMAFASTTTTGIELRWWLEQLMKVREQEGWVKYLGFVPHEVLPSLMAGARLFAYPSLYEGFGLPVLEAMASGVPVVCSNSSTLPEVTGLAAALHDPKDVDALFRLLQAGLEDQVWRKSARDAGIAQAAKFSWQRCTQQTLDVYQKVLDM